MGLKLSPWDKDKEEKGTYSDLTETLKYEGEIELLGKDGHVEYGSTFGMAVVGDSFLVSTDAAKKCVRCFDMVRGKQQVGRYDIADVPLGITTIPDNRVAVTSADKVWFLRVTEKGDLLFENKLHVKKRCLGIASSDDNLIVCYRYPAPGVQILDTKGNVIREIRSIIKKDDDGERLFESPTAVAVSPDHCTIYITDTAKNTVTALTQDGRVLGVVYVKEDLPFGSGITVDSAGRVFVSGYDTVLLVSFETGTVTPLLKITDCKGPLNEVAVCDKTQRLYVSSKYGNVIRVFEMPTHTTA